MRLNRPSCLFNYSLGYSRLKLGGLILSLLLALVYPHAASANDQDLPELGDSASAQFSLDNEYQLGRAWLKALRSRTPVLSDPLLNDYVKYLVYQLAETSELKDRRLEIVLVDSPALNAFAVPGGIVGVNGGLFLYAPDEQAFASVLAHELAHVSQRHFARSVAEARANRIPNMVALLASIVVAAAAGGDAGIAAITATQGLALDQKLRYSRQNEQEADRVGIKNLARAGMDPEAMARMFEAMLAAQRLQGGRPPEFLLTHPLTEGRVSDARSRAKTFPKSKYQDNHDFLLMKNKLRIQYASTPTEAVKLFSAELAEASDSPLERDAASYGLGMSLFEAGRLQEAEKQLRLLVQKEPNRIIYIIGLSDILLANLKSHEALGLLSEGLILNPDNHPLSLYYAKALEQLQRYDAAAKILTELSERRPNDPNVWYQLAEVQGLARNRVAVHRARAEYFILTGDMDSALNQLEYAKSRSRGNFQLVALINERIKSVHAYREQMKRF